MHFQTIFQTIVPGPIESFLLFVAEGYLFLSGDETIPQIMNPIATTHRLSWFSGLGGVKRARVIRIAPIMY